ncbi:MAG TPA: hypothetical protein PKC45_06295 [Gemmatales bacterium]|nr:hypothetical protein [Gemmatales bacterium]
MTQFGQGHDDGAVLEDVEALEDASDSEVFAIDLNGVADLLLEVSGQDGTE